MKKKKRSPLPLLPAGVTVVDTHCHLEMAAYQPDREEVLQASAKAGVTRVITIGIDLETSRQALELADRHGDVFATVGVHPHNVADISGADYESLRSLAAYPKVVAYGEIGLDYVKCYAPKEQQREHFQRQIELGRELNLPLIIHDRGAHDETMAALTAAAPFPAGGVMHCFSGNIHLAEQVMELGFHISIPGVVTFNKAEELHEVAARVPLSTLLLETDGPFLAPEPWRGKRNMPAYILYTADKIARLRNLSLEEVARQTTENAEKLFRLPARTPR
ncbi:MAG: TatD family hydrolase [Desulfobacterales bacterium]|nr:TatD family hydrolase [Desulfobacterales bacterium]